MISILLPIFNGEPHLDLSVFSILNQEYRDIELICIDDGSTDETMGKLQAWKKSDRRVRVIQNSQNYGIVESLNLGIDASRGSVIARQDVDDVSLPTRISKQLPWINKCGYDLVCCRARMSGTRRSIPSLPGFLLHELTFPFWNPFIHGTFMMRKKALVALGGYSQEFKHAEDYYLLYRWRKAGYRIKYLSASLYLHSVSTGSVSQRGRFEQTRALRQLLPLIQADVSATQLFIGRLLYLAKQVKGGRT